MKIRMLKTVKGSENCYVINQYYEGVIYDVSDNLAIKFFGKKYAVKVVLKDKS